jgi:2-keto-4-pentenoate hydratase/2-oxohepta-3-ene-1,7-dioic acid hydratase in catechol pathway
VRNFFAVGLNFTDHAAEVGMPLPKEPILFTKPTNCICGPNDNVIMPRESKKLDYEVELCIVIGKRAQYIKSQADAKKYIAGYCVCNDVSERNFQLERSGGQWDKGKGAENFGPVGPWMVTRDEIKDVLNLKMWANVNGEKRQHGSTKTMIFGAEYLVWYCSQFFILEPGDLITTGTPPGVAQGMKPEPKFLQPGDVVTMGIEGLGEQRQKVVKAK